MYYITIYGEPATRRRGVQTKRKTMTMMMMIIIDVLTINYRPHTPDADQ